MKRDVLITGCAGLLGSTLAGVLKENPELRVFGTDLKGGPAGTLRCNLLEARSVKRLLGRIRPDIIFHLAGTNRSDHPGDLWPAHVETTALLLDAVAGLARPERTRVVIAGSSAEYGAPPPHLAAKPVNESAPTEPASAYGASKLAQSSLALSYRHAGLDIRVARIFNVVGPGLPEHLALGAFAGQIARIEKERQAPRMLVGDLRAERDYTDIRDVARALIQIALRGRSGEIYNVCSGRVNSMRRLLETLISFSDKKIEVVTDPKRLRRGEVSKITGSHRKLSTAAGWKPTVAIKDSLRETLEWHRRR